MINYLIGKVNFSNKETIEFQTRDIGYRFLTFDKIDEMAEIIYIQEVINQHENSVDEYAFKNEFERNIFRSMLEVKGVGVNTFVRIHEKYSFETIAEIIKTSDLEKLCSINGIHYTIAQNIIDNYPRGEKSGVDQDAPVQVKKIDITNLTGESLKSVIHDHLYVMKKGKEYSIEFNNLVDELEYFAFDEEDDIEYVFDQVRERLLTEFTELNITERLSLTLIMSAINEISEKMGE